MKEKYPSVSEATEKERIGIVKEIFGAVTGRYDFLNHFLSLRRDIAWRRFTVRQMRFFETDRFLDVACGTGDLAVTVASVYPQIRAAGIDFVREMIDQARIKAEKRRLSQKICFIEGDALHLPFADSSFDVAGIAFGIRNIPDKLQALREMTRVIVPGGQVMVLEMILPPPTMFRSIYRVYLCKMLPRLARLFSSNYAAYHYLADSIVNFPAKDVFSALMEEAGLMNVKTFGLTMGITYLFVGEKR